MQKQVKCWFCGNQAQRVPSVEGVNVDQLDDKGFVKVVLRERTVQPYGVCGGSHPWYPDGCPNPMFLPEDARFVLDAVLEYERNGGNIRSEFDL